MPHQTSRLLRCGGTYGDYNKYEMLVSISGDTQMIEHHDIRTSADIWFRKHITVITK